MVLNHNSADIRPTPGPPNFSGIRKSSTARKPDISPEGKDMTTRTRPKKPTTAEREPSGGAPASRNRKPGESGLSNEERKTLRKLGSALRSKNYPLDENLKKCRESGKNFQKLRDRSKKGLWAALGELYDTAAGAEANDRTPELMEKVTKDCDY